jgi:hypothetical protein
MREYLHKLAAHEREYRRAAVERDQAEREHARLGMPLLLRAVFPLLAGMWTIVSLGIGGSTMFLVMPWASQRLGEDIGPLLGATVFLGVYAALLLSMRWLLVHERNQAPRLPTSILIRETCPGCGGGVPVAAELESSCPFCGATVVASDRDQQRVESAVRATVEQEKGRARSALRKATQSGAENAQAVLDGISMVTLLPLVFVALPVTLGRGVTLAVGHALWPVSTREIEARDTLDIVSMVASGVLAITFIVIGILFSVRRARKRREAMGQ